MMDHLEVTSGTTTSPRPRALTDVLAILERGMRGVRAEMGFGLKLDEKLMNELEARVTRLREMIPGAKNR